jgi:hypothetical protein
VPPPEERGTACSQESRGSPAVSRPSRAQRSWRARRIPSPKPPPPQDLQKQIEELRRAHDAEIEDLRDEIDKLAEQVSEASRKSQTPAQQPPSIFNPAITAFGNFYYSSTDKPVFLDNDPNEPEVNDQFRFREAELDIRAPIDPWADGVLIASFEEQRRATTRPASRKATSS